MVADCGPIVPAMTVAREQPDAVVRGGDLLVDQRLDVLVVDVLLAVGERLEAVEGVLDRVVAELVAELLQLRLEGGAAGMLAHDERGLRHADRFRRHDLVGLAFFSMPSWWMPLSCAKAFRPTIALLYCTGNEVTAETSREARVSCVASMPVV